MAWFNKQKNQGVVQTAGKQRLSLADIALTGGGLRIRDVSNALWFPAGQPINPVAPRGTPPRRYPYQPMVNINWTSRDGQVDHQTLRNFSYYPIVRDIIETVKDLLTGIEFDFGPVPEDDDEPVSSLKSRGAKDPRIPMLKKFFKKPDGVLPFRTWIRGLYDDMLVLDAASIWKQRDKSGKICSLIQIDGAQVFPLIDEVGMQPDSGIDSETNPNTNPSKKMLVQTAMKKASKDYLEKKANWDQQGGSPAFQLTPYGFPAQELTSDELTYAIYNRLSYRRYGFSKTEACLAYIALSLGRLDFQAAFYKSGNMPEGLAFLPPDIPPNRVDELNKYLDQILSGNNHNRRKLIYLPSYGSEKQPNVIFPKINDQVLKDEFDEWLARVLCHNYGISPMAFTKQVNRGESKDMKQSQANEALQPCLLWARDLINGIIQEDFGFDDLQATTVVETDLDEEKRTSITIQQHDDGLITTDEARSKLGYETIGEDWSKQLIVKTANGFVRADGLPMPGQQMDMDMGGSGKLGNGYGQQAGGMGGGFVQGGDGDGGVPPGTGGGYAGEPTSPPPNAPMGKSMTFYDQDGNEYEGVESEEGE